MGNYIRRLVPGSEFWHFFPHFVRYWILNGNQKRTWQMIIRVGAPQDVAAGCTWLTVDDLLDLTGNWDRTGELSETFTG